MIRFVKAGLSMICLALAFSSCEKGADSNQSVVTPPDPSDKSALNRLFSPLTSGIQEFSVTAGDSAIRYGFAGSKLTFYANSFIGRDGKVIHEGKIDIRLIEIYNDGIMAANRATTTHAGDLLKSVGMVWIKAYKNGEEIYPTRYGLGFRATGPSTESRYLFLGNSNNEDSVLTWNPVDNLPGTFVGGTIVDSIQSTNHHLWQFDSTRHFGWIGAHQFFTSTAPKTNLEVVIKDDFYTAANTQVYLLLPDLNGVTVFQKWRLWDTNAIFNLAEGYLVPANMPIKVVGLSNQNGVYHFGKIESGVSSATYTDTLNMTPMAVNDILWELLGL